MKRLAVLILCVCILAGCANAMQKACKELTKAHDFMVEAEVVAQAGHEKDPNIITEDHLIQLEIMSKTISRLSEVACGFSDLGLFDK